MSNGQNVPAGWYVDQAGTQRWWDGAQWGMSAAEWVADHAPGGVAANTVTGSHLAGEGVHAAQKPRVEENVRTKETARTEEKAARQAEHDRKKADRRLRHAAREHRKEQATHQKEVAKQHPDWQRKMAIAEEVLHTIETASPTNGGDIVLHSGELFYQSAVSVDTPSATGSVPSRATAQARACRL